MGCDQLVALAIFGGTYGLIISEKVDRLAAAMAGICAMLIMGLVEQSEAFSFIDFNTIGLLLGMMILVGIVKKTGLVELAAVRAITLSAGSPVRLLVLLSSLTALLSAMLDNVTTVLVMGPIMLAVCDALDLNPMPFALSMIFASNIGGTATLVGDPPNILIGSAARLSFNDFLLNMAPVSLVCLILSLGIVVVIYRRDLMDRPRGGASFNHARQRLDRRLTPRVLAIMGGVLAAFLLHGVLQLEAATIALAGAALAMLTCPVNVEELITHEVDWTTLVFFSALFMLVGTVDHLGVIEMAAKGVVSHVGGSPHILSMTILWASGFLSAVLDNVPYAAAMIPMVKNVSHLTGFPPEPLWWSLALGVCLGGNGTLVGASANIVMARLAERSGCQITFRGFMKTGSVVTIATLAVSAAYVLIRYS
ncbi:ArsB/NhaD family transporter [Thermanaerovibrio acidaminovorans]|uniref:SLC13 family permease n=1 Tax=Thermanaerovibrio acidaminovorans TaxID=81462 RepID=UPI0024915889|nr:ArsB/NhaD family transporter [Thermanaerovibrio acidaminovorans]